MNIEIQETNLLMIQITELNLNVACIYKGHNTNSRLFITELENKILSNQNTIIVGDMNLNLKNDDEIITEYRDTIHSNGYTFLNSLTHYTRKSNNIETIIDHIYLLLSPRLSRLIQGFSFSTN